MRVEKIAIVSHDNILYINIFDIVYCVSEGLTVTLFLSDGEIQVVNKQLSKIQSLLPDLFVRINQCVIINKLYLNKINKKEKLICLEGNISLTYTMALGKLLERIGTISSRDINYITSASTGFNDSERLEVV